MSFLVIYLHFIMFLPLLGVGADDCMPIKCGKHGPTIQFPFRLKHEQPEDCGYPGFEVYCGEENETLLELPSSVKLVVKKVNYVTQSLYLSDPENCLPQKLPNLSLSASPFHIWGSYLNDYIMFNCSAGKRSLDFFITCIGGPNYHFYAVDASLSLDSHDLTSCTKIDKISSVQWKVFEENKLQLGWYKPACGSCEEQGKGCGLVGGYQVRCMERSTTKKGASKVPQLAGAALGSCLFVVILGALFHFYSSFKTDKENQKKIQKFLEDYDALKPTRFGYSDIRKITNQFSEKLGEGGYGIVYKGKLSKEIDVAVKVLNNSKGNGEEFVNEVGTIGRIHHVNVVRLIGFCAEGFSRALVYEFLPNESLEKFIFEEGYKKYSFGWKKLQDIALGISKGIEYLHQGCDQQILHFDIKPHNIMLDHNFNPKICDFGLAKLCSKEQSGVTMTAARGTMGYIAPEVLSRTFGRVSYKSDVYSFGMLLLELVGGRKNVDPKMNTSQVYFPQWIYNHLSIGEDFWEKIVDEEDGNIASKLAIVGLWCIQWHPTDRPSMKLVVQMLEGDTDNLTVPPDPFPPANAANFAEQIRGIHYQTELPVILELD